ncbi:MAG: hypothetical protein K6T73_10600 [Candidatus Bathyarchaeota archaeon]|nr:hypothetical protein [Candidatus Bathyarchaeota archaeon]
MREIKVGEYLRKKKILDLVQLSNGWYVIKTEDSKSARDFKVKTIFQTAPRIRSITPKHAHFVIDFYGKLCANREKAMKVLEAIVEIWNKKPVQDVLSRYQGVVSELPGYKLEYILHALNWILEQEDVNFAGRPERKQEEINEILQRCNVTPLPERLGSELAMSLFCNVALGSHPVEAFIRANLDVLPVKRARGAV